VGVLSDLAGNRAVVLAASASLALGMIGYSLAREFGLLVISMGFLGLGLGGTDMAGNMLIVSYYAQNKGRYLNLMAFFHGLSSTIAPYYAGLLLAAGVSWRQVYQYPLIAVGLMLALGVLAPFPKPKVVEKRSLDFHAIGKVILQPAMGWFFFMMIVYVSSEIGVASWIVTYLQRIHNLGVTESAAFLSLYFAGIMVGRLLGTFLVERLGYLRSVLLAAIAASLCLAIGTFGPGQSYVLLPLTGLFFSLIFPTLTAAASDRVTENVGTVMGLLFAFCGIGGALGPWIIGLVSNAVGIQAGFAVNLVTSVLTVGGTIMAIRAVQKR
jgi:fucose permease